MCNAIKAAGIAPAAIDEDAEMAMMNDGGDDGGSNTIQQEDEAGWEEYQEEEDAAEVELDVAGQSGAGDSGSIRASTGASSSSLVWEPEQPKHRGHEPSLAVIRSLSNVSCRNITGLPRSFQSRLRSTPSFASSPTATPGCPVRSNSPRTPQASSQPSRIRRTSRRLARSPSLSRPSNPGGCLRSSSAPTRTSRPIR